MPKSKPVFTLSLSLGLCLATLLINLLFPLSSFSQTEEETMTITTYYPAPYGVYNEMRSKKMAVGDNYYNGSQYCWSPATCTNQIDGVSSSCWPNCNTDLIVEGKVGIGTASPTSRLNIWGTAADENTYLIDFTRIDQPEIGGGIRWRDNTNTVKLEFKGVGGGSPGIYFKEGAKDRVVIRNGGNVGIGTTNPAYLLDVDHPTANSNVARIKPKVGSGDIEVLGVGLGAHLEGELLTPPREVWDVEVSAIIRQSLGEEVHMSAPALFRLLRQPPQVNQLHLLIDPLALPALYARVKTTPAIAGLTLWTDVTQQIDATMAESIRIVTVIFSSLGMLIAVGVVYNAARIQLAERAHELASLRVLGFSRAEVGYVLVGEMMFLTVLAIPPGWGLGYGFAALVHSGFSTDIVSLPFRITSDSYALASVLVFVAALVSSLWVRRRLDGIDLVMALKQKE